MRILIVSQYYWPERYGAGVYVSELAEALQQRGHQVTVLTSFPNYPEGRVFPAYRHKFFQIEWRNGVRIIRTWIYAIPRTRTVALRGLSYLSFALTALVGTPFIGEVDLVYSLTPPPMALSAWLISRFKRALFLLSVKDVFPYGLTGAALLRTRQLVQLFEGAESFLCTRAHRIHVESDTLRRNLLSRGVPSSKIEIIPDWADGNFIKPQPKENAFRTQLGLGSHFVVLYSGNMGYTSDLETVIEAAERVMQHPDIQFILVGDGVKRTALEQRVAELCLPNVRFLPFQPREVFPRVLAAADVCLITLNKQSTTTSAQGKLYSILAAGRPVIGVIEPETDAYSIITTAGCGATVRPGDSLGLADLILKFKADSVLTELYGQRARQYFEANYTLDVCVQAFEHLMLGLVER